MAYKLGLKEEEGGYQARKQKQRMGRRKRGEESRRLEERKRQDQEIGTGDGHEQPRFRRKAKEFN